MRIFEQKRQAMIDDKTTARLSSWIANVCSLYISLIIFNYAVNVQDRGEGAERATRQIVKGFLEKRSRVKVSA